MTEDNKQQIEIVRGRDFEETEVQEINKYILTNVPYSVLEQIFPLTENVINKLTVFITVHRLIKSSISYVSTDTTKDKLNKLINQVTDIHKEVYKDLITYQEGEIGSGDKYDKLVSILSDEQKNELINNLVDVFLVFAEKQKLFNLDKITGVRTDDVVGEQIADELSETQD